MRSVWFCLGLALLLTTHSAEAQTERVRQTKPESAAKQAAPDTRPRYRRDDTPAPVVVAPATPAVQPVAKKKRSVRRKPETPAAPAAADAATMPAKGAKATPRDIVACAQDRVADLTIAGCTRIIEDARQKPKARGVAFYNRGNAYVLKGDHDKAIADFDEALKLEPKNASIYNNRGNAHNDKGEGEAAMADFDAALKSDPRSAAD